MKNKSGNNLVKELSKGLLITVSDMVLYSLILLGSSVGNSATSKGVYKSFYEADKIFEQFNTRSILNALSHLKNKKRYICYKKVDKNIEFQITGIGRKRISSFIPLYKTKRPWDGRFYFYSFDIPENKRKSRDTLRHELKNSSVRLVQNSLWISAYKPDSLLKEILNKFLLTSWVITFSVDKYSIGPYFKSKLPEFLEKTYNLSKLDYRYKEFIKKSGGSDKLVRSFEYLSILKDDPQLPFELEPKDFAGKKAYQIYKRLYQ